MTARNILRKIDENTVAAYLDSLKNDSGLAPASINRKRAALAKFFDFTTGTNLTPTNPLHTTTYKKALQQAIRKPKTPYDLYKEFLFVGAVMSLLFLIGVGINRRTQPILERLLTAQQISQSVVAANTSWALPIKTALITPDGTKIASPSAVIFRLYDDSNATEPLWVSSERQLIPDTQGFITTGLGLPELGDNEILSDLFFKHDTLYVEPEVTPYGKLTKIPVSTAARSANSLLLDGYVAALNAGPFTIPVINENGEINLSSDAPTINAPSGRLKFEGQGITIAAAALSNESITLAPDGDGTVNFRLSGTQGNQIDIRNSNMTTGTLVYGHVGNDTTGFNLLDLQSGASPSSQFKVDGRGNTTIAGSLSVGTLGHLSNLGDLQVQNAAIAGTLSVDGDLTFIGPQSITTSTGNLTLSPADTLDLPTKILNASTTNDGRVYIDDTLHVQGGMYSRSIINSGPLDTDTISAVGEARFGDASTDPVYIAGTVTIGSGITPSYQLQLSEDSAAKPTSNTWTVVSDERLKQDIKSFTDGLSVINQINPVSYVLNGKGGTPLGTTGIGILAQKVKDIIPYTINTFHARLNPQDTQDTELFSFNSSALTFVLINAVKELSNSLESANHKFAELQSKKPIVSPITEIQTDIISLLSGNNVIVKLKNKKEDPIHNSAFIIHDSDNNPIATIDASGSARFEGTVSAPAATFDTLLAKEVTTDHITAQSATISGIATINEVEAQTITTNTLSATEATISSLFADEVTTRDGKLSDLIERVKKYLEPQPTAADLKTQESSFSGLLAQLKTTPIYEGINTSLCVADGAGERDPDSADCNEVEGALAGMKPEARPAQLNSDELSSWFTHEMSQGISPSTILIGDSLYISGQTIDSGQETLHIQRFARAPIEIMGGQLMIDTDGNVFMNRNLSVLGTVATNTISPLPQGDLTIDLNKPIYGSTSLTTGESTSGGSFDALLPEDKRTPASQQGGPSRFAKLIINGIGGTPVATIDASGSATFAGDLAARTGNFNKLIIASSASPAEALAKEGTTAIASNASTGTAILPAGLTKITIESAVLTDKSLVYLTPVSSTYNNVLYVAAKKSSSGSFNGKGYFEIAVDQPVNKDIEFNWWIIN